MLKILNKKIDGMECGEILPHHLKNMEKCINGIVKWVHEKGITGKYYIHFWFQTCDDVYKPVFQIRKSRPSPYQMTDHFLWSVEDSGLIKNEWCIPKKEVLSYILANPHEFDISYVAMLKRYCSDKIEKMSDYLVGDKIA